VVPNEDYRRRHPDNTLLLIEVAESSLRKDRRIEAALYARAGVAEYWIVALPEKIVEVYGAPRDGAYTKVTKHGPADVLHPAAFPDIAVPVADVLPI
jgi:Uma2 family endonuclease